MHSGGLLGTVATDKRAFGEEAGQEGIEGPLQSQQSLRICRLEVVSMRQLRADYVYHGAHSQVPDCPGLFLLVVPVVVIRSECCLL